MFIESFQFQNSKMVIAQQNVAVHQITSEINAGAIHPISKHTVKHTALHSNS